MPMAPRSGDLRTLEQILNRHLQLPELLSDAAVDDVALPRRPQPEDRVYGVEGPGVGDDGQLASQVADGEQVSLSHAYYRGGFGRLS